MINIEKIFKVLSNPVRLKILNWLKNPEDSFSYLTSYETVRYMLNKKGGICVGDIVSKSGLAQSTMSKYLSELENINFLVSERHGKWTYYRRNEEKISSFCKVVTSL